MSYAITKDFINFGNARSGQRIGTVKFIVAHDTGNPGSTAYANRNYFHNSQPSASAHTFIDDQFILEMIPVDVPEKAWHVQYQKPADNQLFGADANDAAIAVELCWGGAINFTEAYKRYVWYMSYLCIKFGLDPKKHIVSHKILDPQRRSDPDNALNRYGITFEQFINDVSIVYAAANHPLPSQLDQPSQFHVGERITLQNHESTFRIRVKAASLWYYDRPDWNAKKATVKAGEIFTVIETLIVNGSKMYKLKSGNYITANPQYVERI